MTLVDFQHEYFSVNQDLLVIEDQIMDAIQLLLNCFSNGNKLLICGNGGSSADADHIVGELMKSFRLERPLKAELIARLREVGGDDGKYLGDMLQFGLPAISLGAHTALNSAFANDVDPNLIYAQQVIGYGKNGDVLIGISTSGNAVNVRAAMITARAMNIDCIALTGHAGGSLAGLANILITAPGDETYLIQEQHIKIYHFICLYLEQALFGS